MMLPHRTWVFGVIILEASAVKYAFCTTAKFLFTLEGLTGSHFYFGQAYDMSLYPGSYTRMETCLADHKNIVAPEQNVGRRYDPDQNLAQMRDQTHGDLVHEECEVTDEEDSGVLMCTMPDSTARQSSKKSGPLSSIHRSVS